MPEQPPPQGPPATSGVEASLHAIADVLRGSAPMSPDAQRALADLIDELGSALHSTPVPPAEARHLADSTAHLVRALGHRHDPRRLASARDRLEQAILAVEAQAPAAAGLARRVIDALANVGI